MSGQINMRLWSERFAQVALGISLLASFTATETLARANDGDQTWSSSTYGVSVVGLPSAWHIAASDKTRLDLTKRFETQDGLWFDERMTLAVAPDTFESLDAAVAGLREQGFSLFEQQRGDFGQISVPYWFMHRDTSAEESDWVAILLHSGRAVVADLRCTPLDPDSPHDLGVLVSALRLTPSLRERAWDDLKENPREAQALFRKLIGADAQDANARYGLGLAELAEGDGNAALRDFKLAAPELGLSEDVRRPMGLAEWRRGYADRAAALWIQVIRDNPGWDERVRPWIAAAVQTAPEPHADEMDQLTAIAMEFLSSVKSQDLNLLTQLQSSFRRIFDKAIESCLTGGCEMRGGLLAAYDMERGMSIAESGVEADNSDKIYEGEQKIADGFKGMADQASAGTDK